MTAKIKLLIKFILFNIVVVTLAFVIIEGTASTIVFFQELQNTRPVAERLHTEYDPELGWVNIPNTRIPDLYGPGLDVTINSLGFRNGQEFSPDVPPGKTRIICSGDSFTFSFGVSNDQTWCSLLAALDPRLETVNMGQGGYGIDQAYLWYKRDGDRLAHDINIFAFITADFDRMQRPLFLGYGKPVLKVIDDELVVTNVPVPRQGFVLPWTTTAYQSAFDELRSVRLLNRLFFSRDALPVQEQLDEPAIREVAGKVLDELARLNAERGSKLVLVYLPVQRDYEPDLKTDTRRRYVGEGAAAQGLVFIDLVEGFRELPEDEIEGLFIPNGAIDFPGAAGHYSARGNEYIANRLYQELLAQPALTAVID